MRGFGSWSPWPLLAAALIFPSWPAAAKPKPLEGPVPAFVEEVIDGDSLRVRARIWLGQELQVEVRLNGVDTAEMHARCDRERELATSARELLQQAVGQRRVLLRNIREDKYAGRVIADVADEQGNSLSAALLKAKLARVYHGGRRDSWCSDDAGLPDGSPAAPTAAPAPAEPQPGLLRSSLERIRSYAQRLGDKKD
jgi:endonuclease YncB( thermonuclease family)